MLNKILGTVFLVASGFMYTAERSAGHWFEPPNTFVVLFTLLGIVLFVVGMIQSKRTT
jgi:hypothetical protein